MRKPKLKSDDSKQSKRFVDMARQIKADESEDALERAFKKVVPGKKPRGKS